MNTSTRTLAPFSGGSLSPLRRQTAASQSAIFTRNLAQNFASTPRSVPRFKSSTPSLQRTALSHLRGQRTCLPRRSVRYNSEKKPPKTANPTPHSRTTEPAPSLTQRLKNLGRQYGWLSLGVYAFLTVLDFPFCFMAVRWLGADRIGHYEHIAVEWIKKVLRVPFPNLWKDSDPSAQDEALEADAGEGSVEASAASTSRGEASLWTQLVLAYAVHKSLIFIRIPLTAALLPKVAKTLRGWGYNVGRPKPTN